jgi:hypothetical protein
VNRTDGLGHDLIVIDPGGLDALLDAANRLEAELYARNALERLPVTAARRALAEPIQKIAVKLDCSCIADSHDVLRS